MEKAWRRFLPGFLVSLLVLSGIVWGVVSLASNGAPTPNGEGAKSGAPTPASSPIPASSPAGVTSPAPASSAASAGSAASATGPASASSPSSPAPTPVDTDPSAALTRYDPTSLSGQAVPLGDPPGWKQVFADDFTEGDVPLGSFPGSLSAKWSANYFDGTPDTAGQKNGGRSGYYPSKVLSVHNGVLDMYLHSEGGVSMGAAPAPKINGDNQPPYDSQMYGMYSVRFRSDAVPGFKTAWLLWPDSGIWPRDGEIDYPEQDLSAKFFAALHSTGSNQGSASATFQTDASFQTWNTATIEWTPGRVEFFLNGKSIGASTSGVPDVPMHYILQTESCLPTCPNPKTQGHLYVDWVAIWALR